MPDNIQKKQSEGKKLPVVKKGAKPSTQPPRRSK